MDAPKDKPQIFTNPYQAYCDTFNCHNQAQHFIGRPDGPLNICLNLCDECLASILGHMPDELKMRMTPPAGYVLVERDYYGELQGKTEKSETKRVEDIARLTIELDENSEMVSDLANNTTSFICTKCGKEFGTRQALTAHMRVHK